MTHRGLRIRFLFPVAAGSPPAVHALLQHEVPRVPARSVFALLRRGDFRAFLAAVIVAGTAGSARSVVLGVTVYQITRDPLSLAWLGLVEAAPA